MIISASRRTDIPAFYSKWFINRIKDGFVMVKNPLNTNQVSKVSLSPDVVDCIVFWTKNAKPIINYLDTIKEKYKFYFQYTLNAYETDVERFVEDLDNRILTFIELSKKIDSKQVIWRYDPIFISDKYTLQWHIKMFDYISSKLKGYTNVCVFSFLDIYEKIKKNLFSIGARTLNKEEIIKLVSSFEVIAKKNNIILKTCCEEVDLTMYNISHSCCIDPILIGELNNCDVTTTKDKNQRTVCGCVESIDIGQYNTCLNGCKYCYANYSVESVKSNIKEHNDNSPLLIGELTDSCKVTERKMKSLKDYRIKLF